MERLVNEHKRQDRRTVYTVNVIKDSFLELIQDNPYSKITIKKICQTADIGRSTFYLHFDSINDVLNTVLDDAIMTTSPDYFNINDFSIDYLKENESLIPACQRVGANEKYRKLLMDPDLTYCWANHGSWTGPGNSSNSEKDGTFQRRRRNTIPIHPSRFFCC